MPSTTSVTSVAILVFIVVVISAIGYAKQLRERPDATASDKRMLAATYIASAGVGVILFGSLFE